MEFHKIDATDTRRYSWKFANRDRVTIDFEQGIMIYQPYGGLRVTRKLEDGEITTSDIRRLKRMDNREIENNIRNGKSEGKWHLSFDRMREESFGGDSSPDLRVPGFGFEHDVISAEILIQAISNFSMEQKRIFFRIYIHGYPQFMLAREMHITEAALSARLSRIREKFRRNLAEISESEEYEKVLSA